jgi:hypothetical protein
MVHHTNRIRVLSPLLTIAYSDQNKTRHDYPPTAVRNMLLNGAEKARSIMRDAVLEMDRVVFLRRPEGQPFTSIMNYHMGLAANRVNPMLKSNTVDKPFEFKDLNKKDRRWVLNKVRMGMLSVSAHLNTGVYLIDSDNAVRTIAGGKQVGAGVSPANEEGYVFTGVSGLLSGIMNGEIHAAFTIMQQSGYTSTAVARVIIHEAFHKYWAVADHKYAHEAGYTSLDCEDAIDNADSFAWAAVSLSAGALILGANSNDAHAHGAAIP